MNKYTEIIKSAAEKYKNLAPRPGYPTTCFTAWRHSHRGDNKRVEALFKAIDNLSDAEAEAEAYIKEYFSVEQKKIFNHFHNHSFNTYLVDELIASFPDAGWEIYEPKPLEFYQGELYRGTLQQPDDAFKNGMRTDFSDSIEDYAQTTSYSVGVSTSKSVTTAGSYQNFVQGCEARARIVSGYLYKINYRDSDGIDIVATCEKRNSSVGYQTKYKAEVNIIGAISSEDIVGAGRIVDGRFQLTIPNPNYQEDKQVALIQKNQALHLAGLFKSCREKEPAAIPVRGFSN